MKKQFLVVLLLLIALADQRIGVAEELCRDDESRDACQLRTGNVGVDASAGEVAEKAKADVAAQNTGDNDASTTNDFLPLLRLLLNDEGGMAGQKVGFEWSDPLGFGAEYPNKLSLAVQKSELYEPLKKALSDGGLGGELTALQDRIDAGDDVSIGFSFSRATKKYGRDPNLHRALFGAILESARDSTPKSPDLVAAENAVLALLNQRPELDSEETSFNAVSDVSIRAQYRALAEREIRLKNDWLRSIATKMEVGGFEGLVRLIDNQPQVSFSIDYRARGDSVGPDAVAATLAWEFGGKNLNSFRKYATESCPLRVPGQEEASQVACLPTYLQQAESAQESLRFKLAARFSELQRFSFSLASSAFSFSQAAVKQLELSTTVSRQLGGVGGKSPRPRVDAKLSYEDFSDDPARQDRGLATVTFSFPTSRGFFVTLGAVYATKPEFRGDVDEELSARFGFTYKLIEE